MRTIGKLLSDYKMKNQSLLLLRLSGTHQNLRDHRRLGQFRRNTVALWTRRQIFLKTNYM